MKLVFLSAAAGLAINAQEMNMNIAFKLQNAASQLTSNLLDNQAFASSILTHGCWCAKLSPEIQMPGLGGYTPVDELDQICKDWAKARRCSRAQTCADQSMDGAYTLDAVTYSKPDCVDSDACLSETCQIDMVYMEMIEAFHAENPAHVAVTDPTCQHKAVSNSLVCEPFVTTARPFTTTIPTTTVDQAVDSAISSVLGESTCTGTDCIQFSLYWENIVTGIQSELDMWVTEPSGEQIGWSHMVSSTGGNLDYDGGWSDSGAAVENIQWHSNPPSGTYVVQVHNYDSADRLTGLPCTTAHPCPPIPINVRVVANGVTSIFSFDLDSNMDNSWTQSGGGGAYILHDVHSFVYQSNNRDQAPTLTYAGPGIDYTLRHSYE